MGTCLTPQEMRRGEELRILGMGWKDLGKALGRSPETVRRAMDSDFREYRCKQVNAARNRHVKQPKLPRYAPSISSHYVTSDSTVPEHVLADRDRRAELPRTITSLLCGDPLPGYSALDRR